MLNTINLNEQIKTEPETILDDEQRNDYTAFDGLISTGLTYLEVTHILNVNRTTIWRRQNSIRKKYMATLQ